MTFAIVLAVAFVCQESKNGPTITYGEPIVTTEVRPIANSVELQKTTIPVVESVKREAIPVEVMYVMAGVILGQFVLLAIVLAKKSPSPPPVVFIDVDKRQTIDWPTKQIKHPKIVAISSRTNSDGAASPVLTLHDDEAASRWAANEPGETPTLGLETGCIG